MPTRTAIEQRLAEAQTRLSPRRLRIIQAALENPDETFFLSSRALARRYRVGTGADGRRIARGRNHVRDDVAGSAILRELE